MNKNLPPIENKWTFGKCKWSDTAYLESTGFDKFDVRLYLDGDWTQEQKMEYAEILANRMNECGIYP